MRLLPERNDDRRGGTPCQNPQSDCGADQGRIHEQAPFSTSVPLRHLRRNNRRRPTGRRGHEGLKGTNAMTRKTQSVGDSPITATITRRGFVKIGGTLFVSLALPARFPVSAAESQTSLDPALLASWLEIRSDNTILVRTGRTETGTGMSAYYAQAIAEELNVRPETISLLMGDTDKTPDGGYSAGFLTGMSNVRKVAAYTYQALRSMAAIQLAVPASSLTVVNGIVSANGKSISYS